MLVFSGEAQWLDFQKGHHVVWLQLATSILGPSRVMELPARGAVTLLICRSLPLVSSRLPLTHSSMCLASPWLAIHVYHIWILWVVSLTRPWDSPVSPEPRAGLLSLFNIPYEFHSSLCLLLFKAELATLRTAKSRSNMNLRFIWSRF